MVTSTWQDRELRILEHVVQAWEDGERVKDVAHIDQALGLPRDETIRVVRLLRDGGYLTGLDAHGALLDIEPTSKAFQAIGLWPTPGDEMYDRLLQALDEWIANEPDEGQRTLLQRARNALADVGRNVVASALVEAMKYGAGMAG